MIDEDGVDGLSLRAIARELGVVSGAVYRYAKSRDELLMILSARFDLEIADTVDEALAEQRNVETLGAVDARLGAEVSDAGDLIGTPIAMLRGPYGKRPWCREHE